MANDESAASRATVLARVWAALAREPLPGVTGRQLHGNELLVTLADGRQLRGPVGAAVPFAVASAGLRVTVTMPTDRSHETRGDEDRSPESHDDAADLVSTVFDPADPQVSRFVAELRDSAANLAISRAAQPAPHHGPATLDTVRERADPLAHLEQSVVDGHPLHPLCRTRTGMSEAEIRAYAPEFRRIVELAVVDVDPASWLTTGAGLPPRLVVHPWQRDHVLGDRPELRLTGDTIPARPLMSLRTLAPLSMSGWHLKTALDVQMTSAVRTVSAAAIHHGPLLSALLAHVLVGTSLDVLAEPAAGAVLVDGEPDRGLAVIYRRAPRVAPGEIAMPFAVLSAPSPASGRALVTEAVAMRADGDPEAFFDDLVTITLPPLLRLLHQGVALEAHGENTLVVLDAGRPVRVLYRDMGGVRVSPARLAAAGIEAPPLRGDVGTDDPHELRAKLAAAVLSTVVAELVATIGREYGTDPVELWRRVATVIRRTYRGLPAGAAADEAAILGATLPCKAMTAMRLSPTPLEDIWTPVANPMAGLG